MKRELFVMALLASIALPGYTKDQWPGQSDFDNLNGPVNYNNSNNKPIVDFRFGTPRLPSGPRVETTLTPAEYSYCRHYQYEFPTRDVSCAGPNLP